MPPAGGPSDGEPVRSRRPRGEVWSRAFPVREIFVDSIFQNCVSLPLSLFAEQCREVEGYLKYGLVVRRSAVGTLAFTLVASVFP